MIGALSDVGNIRSINEDYLSYFEGTKYKVYIVADGMGGHNAGEVASKCAVESIIDFIKNNNDNFDMKTLIKEAISYANKNIYKMSVEKDILRGMGTTITAVITDGITYVVANIGDSSCFIVKGDGIIKITKDHSLVQELIDEGSITEEQAKNHPNKNIITRAVGTNVEVQVDLFELECSNIKKLILCTDGLTNEVLLDEILEYIIKYEKNPEICRELINLAKERGGRDNISVMVIEGEERNDRNNTK